MWMTTACAARWACYGFVQKVLWLVGVVMGFFAVCGVSGQYKKRVHVCVCLETLTPCKGAFEKTTPCKGLFEKQSHAIPFQAANKAAIFLYSGASLSSSMK